MPGAARMNDQPRLGAGAHQQAHATGVVEVNVGGHYVPHLRHRQAFLRQPGQQGRDAGTGAGFDEGDLAVADDRVAGGHAGPALQGVEAGDAVHQGLGGGGHAQIQVQ